MAASACSWSSRCFWKKASAAACRTLSNPCSCELMVGCESAGGVGATCWVGDDCTVTAAWLGPVLLAASSWACSSLIVAGSL
eukprot:4060387-Pyramimonas_sp.AAC.1